MELCPAGTGEQTLFARLAVFAGGCTLEAAEAVGNLEGGRDVLNDLEGLVDKNLLQTRGGTEGEPRLLMLETIREYGLERLAERQETETVVRRHADFFLGFIKQAEAQLLGPRQGLWYERLEADLENLRAALTWSTTHQEPEAAAGLAAPIMPFWVSRGLVNEGLRWLDAALQDRDSLSRSALATALFAKAYLVLQTGAHREQANVLLEESLALFRRLEDTTWTVRAEWARGQAMDLDDAIILAAATN